QLVTGNYKMIRIWDIASGKEVRRIDCGDRTPVAVAFSSDGKQVIAVGDDGQCAAWFAVNGKQVRMFALPVKALPSGTPTRFPWHDPNTSHRPSRTADGNWFAFAQGKAIRLVNMTKGKEVTFAAGQPGRHSTIAFTPDSKHLITASEENRLQIWEARSGKLVRSAKEHMQYVYWFGVTPNGKQVVTLSFNHGWPEKVWLEEWSFATAKRQRQLELKITPGIPALSPDGKWLAFGEPNDSRLRMHRTGDAILVDRVTGKEIRHFDEGSESAPQDLTFSAN